MIVLTTMQIWKNNIFFIQLWSHLSSVIQRNIYKTIAGKACTDSKIKNRVVIRCTFYVTRPAEQKRHGQTALNRNTNNQMYCRCILTYWQKSCDERKLLNCVWKHSRNKSERRFFTGIETIHEQYYYSSKWQVQRPHYVTALLQLRSRYFAFFPKLRCVFQSAKLRICPTPSITHVDTFIVILASIHI